MDAYQIVFVNGLMDVSEVESSKTMRELDFSAPINSKIPSCSGGASSLLNAAQKKCDFIHD